MIKPEFENAKLLCCAQFTVDDAINKYIFRHNFLLMRVKVTCTSKWQHQKVDVWVMGHLVKTLFQGQILCAAANNRVCGHA